MIIIKTDKEIQALREGGAILADIMRELADMVEPGITTEELDALAEKRMRAEGDGPSFKGYKSDRRDPPFPTALCTSINHEVVHAPAVPGRKLNSGDIIKIDMGMWFGGMCTDMAATVPVGEVSPEIRRLMQITRESLHKGIKKAVAGAWVSDIGKVVDKHVRRYGYSTVKDLVGHGVGRAVHEDPRVPNFFDPTLRPVRLEKGMTIAIEPMVNLGTDVVRLKRDGWTIVTADGQPSAHFEETIAITGFGPERMTPLPNNV
ncbi:MAG: type I methionyl aminopeptidase [Patescibacteria group bacterium]